MTELEIAASDWKQVCEQAKIGEHPCVWVGHYRGDSSLGSVFGQPSDEATGVLIYGSPFAVSDVLTTFVFVDRPNRVMASRLAWVVNGDTTGTLITDWDLPYSVGDRFEITFGTATKRPHPDERISQALDELALHRSKGRTYDFNTAFWHSVQRGRLI